MVLPQIGVALNPQVPQPASRKKPSQGVVPMMGAKSGVMSAMPAHCRFTFTSERNGKQVEHVRREAFGEVERRARGVQS